MEDFTICEEVDRPENALSGVPDVRAASHDRPNILAVLGGCLSSVAAWSAGNRTHAVLLGFMSAPAACFKVWLLATVLPIQPLYGLLRWIIPSRMQRCHGHVEFEHHIQGTFTLP